MKAVQSIVTILQTLSAVSAMLAAVFWLKSALLPLPDGGQMTISGPNSPGGYMKRIGKISAIAASFAAISAFAQGGILLIQAFTGPAVN